MNMTPEKVNRIVNKYLEFNRTMEENGISVAMDADTEAYDGLYQEWLKKTADEINKGQ